MASPAAVRFDSPRSPAAQSALQPKPRGPLRLPRRSRRHPHGDRLRVSSHLLEISDCIHFLNLTLYLDPVCKRALLVSGSQREMRLVPLAILRSHPLGEKLDVFGRGRKDSCLDALHPHLGPRNDTAIYVATRLAPDY